MNIFKKTAIGIILLLGIVLIAAYFSPHEINVHKTTIIHAPQADVFKAVNELKTWEYWSPWVKKDTTIKMEYSDQSAGNGAYYTWTSENSGAGRMTIVETFNHDSLHTEIAFDGQGTSAAKFIFNPVKDGTATSWRFYGDIPYPFNVMLLFHNPEDMINEAYEEGLALLKTYVEANKTPEYTVKKIDFPATRYLAQKATIRMMDMEEHFKNTMPAVAAAFLKNRVKMAGPASGLFYTWDEETQTSDLAIGIPAAPNTEIDGLSAIDIPATQALQIDYYGPYDETEKVHKAMMAFLKTRKLEEQVTLVIERYITDPGSEANSANWLIEVIYLID